MRRQLTKTVGPQKDKLQLSEPCYRRLFETVQDGILILDATSGRIVEANPFLKKLLGYSEKELLGKELWEIGVFKDIIASQAAFHRLQTKGYIRYKNLPLQTKKGRSVDVEFVSNVYTDGHQKVIQCNIRDITDRRKAEAAAKSRTKELEHLSESQRDTQLAMLNVMEDLEAAKALIEREKARDEAVLASIGEGLIAVDSNRKIVIMNKAAENILSLKSEEMLGHDVTEIPLEAEEGHLSSRELRPTYVAIAEGKQTKDVYFSVRGDDKVRFPMALNVTPIKLNGKIIGAINIFRDTTQEIEMDKAKSEFVSLASHQLRTPLGIMKWYLEALEEKDYLRKAPVAIREYFKEICKSNERVLSLVRDLLSVSRIEQHQVKDNPQLTDLVQVIREVVDQMQILARKKKIALRLTIKDKEIPFINIDTLRIHQVIENLISNAIEYTMPSGTVDVTVDKMEKALVINVKDTGIGISATDQKKLFTKFFRSEKAIGHNPEGTGLGLYVVKSYLDGWGGQASVKSIEGKGSTFTISLPIDQKRTYRKRR